MSLISISPQKPQDPATNPQLTPLTRKAFYDLAEECLEYALEYARRDPHHVSLKHCYEFNDWLPLVKRYDLMAPALRTLTAARPIARWQVMTLAIVAGLIGAFALAGRVDRIYSSAIFYVYLIAMLVLYFLPQRLYGTTIELLEGKLLRIVETMETILIADDLEFSEAAFFQVKENLQTAHHELRQQIDLAHRRWR